MIPTLILFGLVCGRWWRFALVAAAVAWPAALVVTDVMSLEWGLIAVAGLAVANTFAGVLVHLGVLWCVRRACSRGRPMPMSSGHPRG